MQQISIFVLIFDIDIYISVLQEFTKRSNKIGSVINNVCLLAQTVVTFMIRVVTGGPYFPKLGQKATVQKTNIRCPRPQFQMFLHRTQLEASKVK